MNENLFGTNLNWIDYGDGIYQLNNIHPQILLNIKEIGIRTIRYPGGTLSETYEWRNGIEEVHRRKTSPNYLGLHQKVVFGTDEYLQLCIENYITPVITLGYKNGGSFQENISWMDYCYKNVIFTEGTSVNTTTPSIVWEIGNEIYLAHNSLSSAQEYIDFCNKFAFEAKSRHPNASIGVCIKGSPSTWDSVIISKANKMIDFYSYHAYYVFDTSQTVQIPEGIKKIHSELSYIHNISKECGNIKKIVVSEFNILPSDGRSFINISPNIEQAVFFIGCLRLFHEFNIHMAMKWCFASYGKLFFADIQNAFSDQRTYTYTYILQKYLQHQQKPYVSNSSLSSESQTYSYLVLSDSSQQKYSIFLTNTYKSDSVSYKIKFPVSFEMKDFKCEMLRNNFSHQKHSFSFDSKKNEISVTIPPQSIIFLFSEDNQLK